MFISKLGSCCCSAKNRQKLSRELSLLAVKSRLDILFLLKDKAHCVCDLGSHTDLSQSLISHHLADLTEAGMIASKRKGKYRNYCLTTKGERLINMLLLLLKQEKGGGKKYG